MVSHSTLFHETPVDHRQPIDAQNVSSVIHALSGVGKTTTGVVVFLFITATYIPAKGIHHSGDVLYDTGKKWQGRVRTT